MDNQMNIGVYIVFKCHLVLFSSPLLYFLRGGLRKDFPLVFITVRKILSTIVSAFTSAYMFYWKDYFNDPILYPVSFDGRVIIYPTYKHIRDYLSWRQVDCMYVVFSYFRSH